MENYRKWITWVQLQENDQIRLHYSYNKIHINKFLEIKYMMLQPKSN